jgi:UDP-N-acetylmuramate--alanine ligase
VTDVYPAREEPIQGVSGELIANAAKQYGHKDVRYVANKKKVPETLQAICRPDDIVITMGAGDIWKYGEEFLKIMQNKK